MTARPQPVGVRAVHTALTGSAMGIAELVPGFSAGTVAYVAGIYIRFLSLLAAVLRLPVALVTGDAKRGFTAVDWPFALTLATSMLATVFLFAPVVRHLIASQPVIMSAVFFGLVCGAVIAAVTELDRFAATDLAVVTLTAVGVFLGLGFGGVDTPDPSAGFLFLAGMLAISAWVLPGVSGSFTLVVLGVYPAVVGAVADRDLAVLAVFAAGCVAGIAIIVNALTRLLARHGHTVRVLLIGVMCGSARVLWPFSATFASTDLGLPARTSDAIFAAVAATAAAVAVLLVASRASRSQAA